MWYQDLSREEYLKLPKEKRFIKLSKTEEERATELHSKFISVDIHSHTWSRFQGRFDFEGFRESGVTCFMDGLGGSKEDFSYVIEQIGRVFELIDKNPDVVRASNVGDIRRAKKEGKQAYMGTIEVGPLINFLDRIDVLYGMGIRSMGLTYNCRNFIGDGCSERTNSGLSYFGLEVIDRMNKLGMLIDIAHAGAKTALEVIETSKDPVIFSHSGSASMFNSNKLKGDEELKALAEKRGIIGVEAVPNIMSSKERQSIEDVLDHIDYVTELIGVDHVGIGTDILFDDQVALHRQVILQKQSLFTKLVPEIKTPYMWGIENPSEWPNITRGLVSRGYSDQEIAKIIGSNALRLIEKVIG